MSRFVLLFALVGCAAPEPVETPFEGPGYDEVTAQLASQATPYLVGLTELHVKNAPGPGKAFGEHADAVGTYLYEEAPPGFLGGSFRNVGKLEWWTLTVWTDEAAMTEFVVSSPHLDAMVVLDEVAKDARSTHVTFESADGSPPTWDWALSQLEGVDWIVGGE